MAILGVHHVQITVPPGNLGEVRRFYGEILGLEELEVPASLKKYELVWFRLGLDRELHVRAEQGADRLGTFAHVAYLVDDARSLRRRLSNASVIVVEQPVIEGYDRFHIRDPFGNRVEFIQRVS